MKGVGGEEGYLVMLDIAYIVGGPACLPDRPRTTAHERTAAKTVPSKPPRSVKKQGGGTMQSVSSMGGGMQDEVGMGLGTEADNIVDLLNAPDHEVHSKTHSSGIGSGTMPSFAL